MIRMALGRAAIREVFGEHTSAAPVHFPAVDRESEAAAPSVAQAAWLRASTAFSGSGTRTANVSTSAITKTIGTIRKAVWMPTL